MERNEPSRWMQDKHFNEVLFCEDFLAEYPMVCVGGSFFTVEGRVADEESIRKQIYEMLRPHFTSGTARRATSLLETLKLEAYTPELPIQEDRIHVANGTLFLNGEFRAEKNSAATGCRSTMTPARRSRRHGCGFCPICWKRRTS